MTIGEKIKEIRKSKGFSMVQVADGAGMMKQKIWQLENDRLGYPTIPVLMKVAESLGCTVVDLIAEPLGINIPICANMSGCKFFKKKE